MAHFHGGVSDNQGMDRTESNQSRSYISYNTQGGTPFNGPPLAETIGVSALQSIGSILRERREASSISLADVEKATRIRQKYLVAIEADEWHLLPGEVVGRGFLRNYALFLGLDANDLMERRRAATDANLSRMLAGTSAGIQLPPNRQVDYSPKNFDLEVVPLSSRMSAYVAVGRNWFAPIVATVAVLLFAFVIFWGYRQIGAEASRLWSGLQVQIGEMLESQRTASAPEQSNSPAASGQGGDVQSPQAGVSEPGGDEPGESGTGDAPGEPAVTVPPTNTPTPTATPEPPTPTPTDEPPTPTFTPEIPTPTFTPEIPTPTPEPPPPAVVAPPPVEAAPEPAPEPVIVAPSCPDPRAVIQSPGVNQTVSGMVQITGRAAHEQFASYKLEYAPGANADGGYVYFDGAVGMPVEGGVLGRFNSPAFSNGAYTIRLTVVDATGNYPPPCQVTINVQN